MIRKVQITNFKSVADLELDLGRVNVFIGSNGSGKSNILEAISFASAAEQNKLDHEFLASRGIRVTEPEFMRSAFETGEGAPVKAPIAIVAVGFDGFSEHYVLGSVKGPSYPRWVMLNKHPLDKLFAEFLEELRPTRETLPSITKEFEKFIEKRKRERPLSDIAKTLPDFMVYAPENQALRTFQAEGQILPLGIRGEGLFAHLKVLSAGEHRSRLEEIKQQLEMIEWFETFELPGELAPGERSLRIRDRYLPGDKLFDQRSANEGFLYLLFYMTLLISPDTPAFFSIDNIDNSLNPKLCIELLKRISELSITHAKQVILTTHNPAVLDGLNLADDEQRLFVVERNKQGHTRVRRVEPPRPMPGQAAVSLSEAFMRGYIGGLPKNF